MAFDLGPFTDPLAVRAVEPQITEATPGEVQGANLTETAHALPGVNLLTQQQRYNEGGATTPWAGAVDPRNAGSDVDAMAAERGPAKVYTPVQPEDAKAQARAAGVEINFDKPLADTTVTAIIADHVRQQQSAAVIARNGGSILSGSAARFVTSSLLSLADPINDLAMLIPAAPEAFVAEKLAAASGIFGRTLIRGAAGAANGAVGMLALEPLNYEMSQADYNDWTAGDALRNVFMGAALGAGGHMLLGGLFGREHLDPDTAMTATKAAIAQVADDRPVDVAGIVGNAMDTRMADALERRRPGEALDHPTEDGSPAPETTVQDRVVASMAPEVRAQYDELQTKLADPALAPEARAPLDQAVSDLLDQSAPQAAADLRAQAADAADGMAKRAMDPPADPVIAQAERVNKAAIDTAPKIVGVVDKDLAEATKLTQDMHQQLQTEIKAGRIVETQEMRDAMIDADHTENVGKAAAGYASCLAGKGF